jgi:hypothetical protein
VRAATERARALADLHHRFAFDSRDELIEALVALDAPRRPERSSSSKSNPAKARRLATSVPEKVGKPFPTRAAVRPPVDASAPAHSTKRAAVGPMRAASDSRRSQVPEERHAIVVEILTRGDAAAESWLWAQNSREEVRSLIRRFGGAGYDDEARAVLRRKMGLSERDVRARPFRASTAKPPPRLSGTAS